MSTIAIVYHSGFGHTQALAEAVAKGAEAVPNTKVSLIPVADAEARQGGVSHAETYTANAFAPRPGACLLRDKTFGRIFLAA